MGRNIEIKARARAFEQQTTDPRGLKEVLGHALGIRAILRKTRTVYFCGQTRIHLDRVEGLGAFIELEVVLEPGQNTQYGTGVAEGLMSQLDIQKEDLVAAAYVDLLTEEQHE